MEVLFKQVPQDLTNLGMPRLECGDTGAEIVHWGKSDVQKLIQDKVTEGGVGGGDINCWSPLAAREDKAVYF